MGENGKLKILLGMDQEEINQHIIVPLELLSTFCLHLLINRESVTLSALTKLGVDRDFFKKTIIEAARLAKANKRYAGTVNRKTVFKNKIDKPKYRAKWGEH